MPDYDDEPTLRIAVISAPFAPRRRRAPDRPNATKPTSRPSPGPRASENEEPAARGPAPRYVSPSRVSRLFERFARTVDPASVDLLALRAAYPARLTENELWTLMERLALRLPTPAARERFLLDVADLRV